MNQKDFNEAKNHIYGIAHNVSPDKEKQNIMLATLQAAEKNAISDGVGDEELLKILLYPIMDGLQFGNWPWPQIGVSK